MAPITNSAAFHRAVRTALRKSDELSELIGRIDRAANRHPEWKKPDAIREDLEELDSSLEELEDSGEHIRI